MVRQFIDFLCKIHQFKFKFIFQTKNIYSAIEKFKNIKIAPCIKAILDYAAYNSASSLSVLNDQNVLEIENCINESGRNVIESLKCCYASIYQQQTPFRFLPGHKSTVLSIPKYISEMNELKKTSRLEFKKLLTPAELKAILLRKINQNIGNYNANIGVFSESGVTEVKVTISNNSMSAKCKVSCILCAATVPVVYSGSWKISNILRHVRQHLIAKQRMHSQQTITSNQASCSKTPNASQTIGNFQIQC